MEQNFPIISPLPETKLIIEASKMAGKAIMKLYEQPISSSLKNDKEPVTKADIISNEIIKKTISVFNYPILSEESKDNLNRLNSKKIFIVDPLDGTSDYIKKTGEFTVMISLVENKKPILGVIYWPINDILYLAQKDQGSFKLQNDSWSKIFVSSISDLNKSRVVGSRHHISDSEKNLLNLLNAYSFTSKGSSLKVADISSGNAELYFTTTNKIKQWDTCASYCIIKEAGGIMTDMLGNDMEFNTEKLNHENGLLVTNGVIHEQVINAYVDFLKNKK